MRVAIVGAGFSGIGAAVELRRAGIEDFTVFEKADDIGGVWHANTYPGAALRHPELPLLVLLRAAQGLVAALLAAGGDPRPTLRDVARR